MRRSLLLALLVLGCDGEDPAEVCATGEPDTWVISQLTFARRDGNVVNGFDIDGHQSEDGDDMGCGFPDLVDERGLAGIDNGFSALLPVLEATEAVAVENLVEQSISSGELLITLTLDGIDDWQDDTCVDFALGRASGVPLVASDGTLLDSQTLSSHPTIETVTTTGGASEWRATFDGLSFNLPFDVLNAELDFEVTQGRFTMQRRYDDKLVGVMGGVIPIRQIVELLERDDVNLQPFVPIVESTADIRDADGNCTLLSLGFEFEATPVYLTE